MIGKRIDHEGLNAHFEIVDLTQGDVESYFKIYNALDLRVTGKTVSVPENSGYIVRAALQAKIVAPEINVESSKPALIRWLAKEINQAVSEALTIPPLSPLPLQEQPAARETSRAN